MDAEGFVPLSLIANFNRVKALSLDLNVIKDVSELCIIDRRQVRERQRVIKMYNDVTIKWESL